TQVSRPAFYAASALLLLAPEVPLIFMGQEWAAPEPFLFFTDHNAELGRLVTEGRRKEFMHFDAFADEARRESIPDPQADSTFLASKLDWSKRVEPEHAACLIWYQRLLRIRKYLVANTTFRGGRPLNDHVIVLEWEGAKGRLVAVVALEGPVEVGDSEWRQMEVSVSSEDPLYIADPEPAAWEAENGKLKFKRPGAVLLASGDLISEWGSQSA
ncbi:MAG: hypothetical protein ABI164_06895, partial [Acidobacteriaceae bacterium]